MAMKSSSHWDGKFNKNVFVQPKNGPIDFQPREPFHPLFGAMPQTPLMLEFQITQEYLGYATNLAYLGPLFEECLDADTYTKGKGTTVANVLEVTTVHTASPALRELPISVRISTGADICSDSPTGMLSGAWRGIRNFRQKKWQMNGCV